MHERGRHCGPGLSNGGSHRLGSCGRLGHHDRRGRGQLQLLENRPETHLAVERTEDRPQPEEIQVADVLLERRLKGIEGLCCIAQRHVHAGENGWRDVTGLRERLQPPGAAGP